MKDRDRFQDDLLMLSCLPADDPMRVRFEEEMASDDAASETWLANLGEVERIRLGLRRTKVPAGLQASLLALPCQAARDPRHTWWRRLMSVGLIASFVCGLVLGVLVKNVRARRQPVIVLGSYAATQVQAHPSPAILTDSPPRLVKTVEAHVPFPVKLVPASSKTLLGGEINEFRGHRLLRSSWESAGGRSDLFEFRLSDYDVVPTARTVLPLHELEPDAPQCDVTLWTEGDVGFLLLRHVEPAH